MVEKLEQQFKLLNEQQLQEYQQLEQIDLSNKQVRKKKPKKKPKKEELDEDDLFLNACVAQKEQELDKIADIVIALYEERVT